MIRAAIVREPIDVNRLTREVTLDSCGAIAVFLGTVRANNDGRAVTGIEYSSYEEMAHREMTVILGEAVERFGIEAGAIEHRIGELAVGDASIAVVVAMSSTRQSDERRCGSSSTTRTAHASGSTRARTNDRTAARRPRAEDRVSPHFRDG